MECPSGAAGGDFCDMLCTVPSAVVLYALMSSLKRALLAAEKLMDAHSPFWSESFMPTVLFAILGLGFGALIGWRMSAAASLGGLASWFVAGMNIAMLGLAGMVVAPLVFPAGVPGTCWLSLWAMAASAVLGLYLIMAWL